MNLQLKKQLELRYPQLLSQNFVGVDLCFSVQLDNLLSFSRKLFTDLSSPQLVDIVASEIDRAQSHYDITYLLLSLEHNLLVAIQTICERTDTIPSVSSLWPVANYREHEIYDFYNLKFSDAQKTRLYCHPLMNSFPMVEKIQPFNYLSMSDIDLFPQMLKNLKAEQTILNLGPVHPLFQTGMRTIAKVEDETILQLEIEVGLQHKGVEKAASQMTPQRLVHVGSFMGLSFSDTLNCAMAMAIENAGGVVISKRAEMIRLFVLELERVAEHLDSFSKLALLYDSLPLIAVVLRARESVAELCGKLIGKRTFGGTIRIGGSVDIFKNIDLYQLFETISAIGQELNLLEKEFCSKQSWRDILDGGEISRAFAVSRVLVGPNLRAAGVNWDWRKRRPYYCLSDLKFDVPCGVEGSSYDRYVVRLFEMRESLTILQQILESLPSGSSKALKEVVLVGLANKKSYARVEGPAGELGVFLHFNSEGQVARCKISPSSLSSAFALPDLVRNTAVTHFASTLLSLGINSIEMDR